MGKDQEFLEAARNGNITLVEKYLNQRIKRSGPLASLRRGPGINVQDNGGYSALHYSALNGHIDIVRLLLIHEASPNLLDSRGSSALHLASWAGQQEIVKMLLTHPYKPANPNMQTTENETPLHCAAQHGHTGALTTLLAHGADPNVYNSRNETPLDLAAQYGRLQAVQMLIRAHPELLQPYSVDNRSFPTYSSLVDKPRRPMATHSALHLASRNGHNNIVEILLTAGVNVNLLTTSGTALHEAALCGKDLVVRTLLEAGADLNATDSDGRTPLDVLQEFPPHVTKGIISVINSFRTRFDDGLDETYGSDKTTEGSSKDTLKERQLKANNDVAISPSVSMNSFEQSIASSTAVNVVPKGQPFNGNMPDFYVKMEPIRIQRSAPKKPPRRNISISPTHTQNFFTINDMVSTGIEYDGNETAISATESCVSYEYICKTGASPAIYNSKENLVSSNKANKTWYEEAARSIEVKPVPAPRKLKNLSPSYEISALKSYNPNRKLKRNRENYFAKGQFSLTIGSDKNQQITSIPRQDREETPAVDHHFKRPLSQEYTCPPDFLLSNLESENSPQDQHQLCLSLCNSSGSLSSGVSLSDRSISIDCVEEYVGDEPFAGLFKGSTVNLNNDNSNMLNTYFVSNENRQSAPLRVRKPGNDPKTASTTISQSETLDETLDNEAINRKYKKDKHINDDSRCILKESHIREYNQFSTNMNGKMEAILNPVLKPPRQNQCFGLSSKESTVENYNLDDTSASGPKMLEPFNEQDAWQQLSQIMETFGSTILNSENNSNGLNSNLDFDEMDLNQCGRKLASLLEKHDLSHLEKTLYFNGYDNFKFVNGIFDDNDLSLMKISSEDGQKLVKFVDTLPFINFTPLAIESSLDQWLKSIYLMEYSDNFKKHLYNTLKSVCGVWEIELQTVLEINKIGHRKRILHSVGHIRHATNIKKSSAIESNTKIEVTTHNAKGTLKHNKKNRPAPKPPLDNLEIRAPSELLIGLPSNLRIKWPHLASSLVSHFLKYEVYYLGSTVVKELRGTESTRKSIQKLKRVGRSLNSNSNQNLNSDSNHHQQEKRSLVQLSISYRGVEFIDVETNGTICEHEIRNINCACQDADDMSHFAYITKDNELNTHYCHVFNVDSMHMAMEIILTLAESFEVAYQMALKNTAPSNYNPKDLSKNPIDLVARK